MRSEPYRVKSFKTRRDIRIFEVQGLFIVVGCDAVGGVGPKPLDKLRVEGYTTGKFLARVALMEVLSVGAKPFCLSVTLSVEPEPTGNSIMKGIRRELQDVCLSIPIAVSSEKNFQVHETGAGVTAIGMAERGRLKVSASKPGDLVVAVGVPSVGSEVLRAEEQRRIADIQDLQKLLSSDFVHEVIPAGSRGIAHEARVLAGDSCIGVKLSKKPGFELTKSAGPATVLVATLPKEDAPRLRAVIDKPLTIVGSLH